MLDSSLTTVPACRVAVYVVLPDLCGCRAAKVDYLVRRSIEVAWSCDRLAQRRSRWR